MEEKQENTIEQSEENILEKTKEINYSGKLQCIFPDGTIQYDDVVGKPSEFPLTKHELSEVENAING